ncbi:hypothetical protein MC885_009341, partial [Smutsia gigantea]
MNNKKKQPRVLLLVSGIEFARNASTASLVKILPLETSYPLAALQSSDLAASRTHRKKQTHVTKLKQRWVEDFRRALQVVMAVESNKRHRSLLSLPDLSLSFHPSPNPSTILAAFATHTYDMESYEDVSQIWSTIALGHCAYMAALQEARGAQLRRGLAALRSPRSHAARGDARRRRDSERWLASHLVVKWTPSNPKKGIKGAQKHCSVSSDDGLDYAVTVRQRSPISVGVPLAAVRKLKQLLFWSHFVTPQVASASCRGQGYEEMVVTGWLPLPASALGAGLLWAGCPGWAHTLSTEVGPGLRAPVHGLGWLVLVLVDCCSYSL